MNLVVDLSGTSFFCFRPAQVAKVGIALAIFFTYALQMYVPFDITWNKVLKERISEKYSNISQIILRTTVVGLTVVVAAVVHNLEPFIGLVGSIFFSILGLFVPAVIETITYWEYDMGYGYWKLWKNIGLAILAFVALVAGSVTSMKEIIESF